ncbi:MAG: 5-oxoprolinase subunit PxpA [Pyrinomonadaceae bacterium]
MSSIDLNCDMGEGCPHDTELMHLVSSVSIAGGYHAGDEETMRATVRNAVKKGVAIGAHPSYLDRDNFGRTSTALSFSEIIEIVTDQIRKLDRICGEEGSKLVHVKPHGALYNQSAKNSEIAAAIAQAVRTYRSDLILFGLSGSLSISEAEKIGLQTASEAFADRTYRSDGTLTPRSEPNALITDPEAGAEQAMSIIVDGSVVATGGKIIEIAADTLCIHGDGEYALEFANAINRKLTENGIKIEAING